MQNWLCSLAESVRQEGKILEAIEDGRVPFVDTRDIAEVALRVLTQPEGHAGRTYVLTGAEAVTYHEVAGALSEILGRPVAYLPQSFEQARERMERRGMPAYLIDSSLGPGRLSARRRPHCAGVERRP